MLKDLDKLQKYMKYYVLKSDWSYGNSDTFKKFAWVADNWFSKSVATCSKLCSYYIVSQVLILVLICRWLEITTHAN